MLTAPNGKIYVGSALNGFHERSRAYRNESAHNNIQNALKKYEAKNFVFSILESSSTWQKDKLQEREQHYLDTLQPFGMRGYNVERVAGVVNAPTRRVSQFTRAGEPVASYESITWASVMARADASDIGQCCKGKKPSARRYLWIYSKDVNEQEIARRVERAASVTSLDMTPRRVNQYSKAGEFIESYVGIKDAVRATGTHDSSISKCCKSKLPSAGRFLWLYTEEATPNEIARRVKIASSVTGTDKRRVSQYTKAGEFIASFESGAQAARATGAHKSHITGCARGRRKSAGNFIWRYDSPRPTEPVEALERENAIVNREAYLEAVAREREQVSLAF